MIDINGITRILSDFKSNRHAKNPCVVMGDSPEMDAFSKGDELKRVTISRSDVLMLLDSSDSRGFKLFGKHKEKPGQYGILFTKKGIVALNRSGDAPGRTCGFISWEAYQFCRALLVDQRQSERFDYETDAYPGKFVFMCYDCGLESDELYENVMRKIEKLLGCNNDWVEIVKAWK